MKHLLIPAAVVLLLVAIPLIVWRIFDDPLERRVAPLIGIWCSSRDNAATLRIRIDDAGGCITVRRRYAPRSNTYRLRYDDCLHFIDTEGKRIDVFYSPEADVVLLMPGGTFQRIPNQEKDE